MHSCWLFSLNKTNKAPKHCSFFLDMLEKRKERPWRNILNKLGCHIPLSPLLFFPGFHLLMMNRFFVIIFMHMLFCCIWVYTARACSSRRPEESVQSPGTGVTENWAPSYRCWEFNEVLYKSNKWSLLWGYLSRPMIDIF